MIATAIEPALDHGPAREADDLAPLARLLGACLHLVLAAEVSAACAASPFERSGTRSAHRGGTAPRRIATPFGCVVVRVPRLAGGGFRSVVLPTGGAEAERLASLVLQLAAGINSWSAALAIVEPLRRLHGDGAWIQRTARRILAAGEAMRHPRPPVHASTIATHAVAPAAGGPVVHVIAMTAGGDGATTRWFLCDREPGAWDRCADRLHGDGLRRIDRAILDGPDACVAAVVRRWPDCRIDAA